MSVVRTSSLWLRLGALTTVCGSLLAGILVWQTKLILAEFGAYLSTTEILMLGANSIDVALLMIVGGVVAMLASIWLPRGQKIVDQCAVDMLSTDRSLEQCEARARRPSHHASE